MRRDDANRRVLKMLSAAGELLREAREVARDHSISFSTRSALPFEVKYDYHLDRWTTGDEYWQEFGCTIGTEDLDEWNSSSNC